MSNPLLYQDGYDAAKAGEQPLPSKSFESPQDFQTYMDGYNAGKPKQPFLTAEWGLAPSGVNFGPDSMRTYPLPPPFHKRGWW